MACSTLPSSISHFARFPNRPKGIGTCGIACRKTFEHVNALLLTPALGGTQGKKVVSVIGEKKGLPAGGIENLNRFREVPLLVLAESRFQVDQPSGFAGSLRCTEFGRGLGAALTLPLPRH